MISVIVPVYNVEPYLRKCLVSILNQTYRDLEILIIDDGSIDRSGEICDEYKRDNRVRVFHTENRGLSAARNLGLDEATGDWIGFVDSDDWIEPEMYEALLKHAKKTGADIVECGVLKEYRTKTIFSAAINHPVSDIDALNALVNGDMRTQVWNKIYRISLFDSIRFPEGRSFEDVLTTHKLLVSAKVIGVEDFFYHYIQRESSISQNRDMRSLIDYWEAHKQRYEDLRGRVDEASLLRFCASAIGRTWAWYIETEGNPAFISEISDFIKSHYSVFANKKWPLYLKVSIFLARFNNRLSYSIAFALNYVYRFLKPQYYE